MLQVLEGNDQGGAPKKNIQQELCRGLIGLGFTPKKASWLADQLLIASHRFKVLQAQTASQDQGLGVWGIPDWVEDAWDAGYDTVSKGIRFVLNPAGYLVAQSAPWLFANVLGPVIKKIAGNSVGGKIVGVMEALVSASDAASEYLLWTLGLCLDMVVVIVQGIRRTDFGYIMNKLGTMLSKALLRAPGMSDILVILARARDSSDPLATTKRRVQAQLDRLAEKDPAFGINVIMFVISTFPWPATAAKLAVPATAGPVLAQFLGVLRKVIVELTREELRLNEAQIRVVDKVYGLVLMALMQVQDFPSSLQTLGVARDKADALWSSLYSALKTFSFDAVIASFQRIIGALGEAERAGRAASGPLLTSIQGQLQNAISARVAAETRATRAETQKTQALQEKAATEQQLRTTRQAATASSTESRTLARRLATAERQAAATGGEWKVQAERQRKIAIAGVATAGVLALLLAAGV